MDFTREGRAVTYIHYGASEFDPEKFKPAVQDGCWDLSNSRNVMIIS